MSMLSKLMQSLGGPSEEQMVDVVNTKRPTNLGILITDGHRLKAGDAISVLSVRLCRNEEIVRGWINGRESAATFTVLNGSFNEGDVLRITDTKIQPRG